MNKTVLATSSAVCLALTATTANASPPRIYHNVSVESASFDSVQVDGCLQTELYLSATTGRWSSRTGPTAQEGPSSVFVRVTDVCATDDGQLAAAAAPPGGAVVLEASGQAMIGLVTDQHLGTATGAGTMQGEDQDGNPLTIEVTVTWTASGDLVHQTGHSNDHYPEGNVSAVSNEWSRAATADAQVSLDGWLLTGHDEDSLIQRVKGRCIEVPKGSNPAPEEFFPCFGFPA